MNTNIVLFTILNMSKVFLWPHNHLLHWSPMIISICKYISNITCDKREGEWHETSYAHARECLDDSCAHEMQVLNACLTLGCYTTGTRRMEKGPAGTRRMEIWSSEDFYDELQASQMSNCRSHRYTSDGESTVWRSMTKPFVIDRILFITDV